MAAVVTVAVAHWAAPARAQQDVQVQPNPNQLQTVPVTANKRVERQENLPEPISVLC